MDDLRKEAERRLIVVLGLTPERAARAVEEIFDALRLDVDAYIVARHAALQASGVTNPEIYERIAEELPLLRFAGPTLTARQIRRRIYG